MFDALGNSIANALACAVTSNLGRLQFSAKADHNAQMD
jgi:hypothetical protein